MITITTENLFLLLKNNLPENPIIVEAGAFNGCHTKKLSSWWPNATIHAFEPVPAIFNELRTTTALYPHIHCYNSGLSTTTGKACFYVAHNPKKPNKICSAGSLLKPKDRLLKSPIIYPSTIIVDTITLDQWAQAHAVTHIDFLWLDIQGHELATLQASPNIFSTITLIYLEINFIEAYEGQESYETTQKWFIEQGFEPIAQDFDQTHTWFFGNILYKRRSNSN